jgi:hypothetical protein
MPRGGRRDGTPGRAYGNRSDLNGPKPPGMPLPVQAASGQAYGARKQQEDAQRAIPMASAPGMSQPAMSPEQIPSLTDPTTRPNEPVTAGLPVGPGPGPEALGGALEPDTGLTDMLAYLPMLEFLASQPGSSAQTRQMVRRLRAGQVDL